MKCHFGRIVSVFVFHAAYTTQYGGSVEGHMPTIVPYQHHVQPCTLVSAYRTQWLRPHRCGKLPYRWSACLLGAPMPSNYIANPDVLYVHEARVWDEGKEYSHGMTIAVLWQIIWVETPLFDELQEHVEGHRACILNVVCISTSGYPPYVSLAHSTALTH